MAPRLADHKLYFYSTSSPSLLGVVTAYTIHVLSWKYKLDRIPTRESFEKRRAPYNLYTRRVSSARVTGFASRHKTNGNTARRWLG
jgi:hypothetical protein